MKLTSLIGSVALAALLAGPAAALTYDISGYDPGGYGAVTGTVNLTVSGGVATSGTATLSGGILSPSTVSFGLVTATCCGYPNNPPHILPAGARVTELTGSKATPTSRSTITA
jgi:hypothetical protein